MEKNRKTYIFNKQRAHVRNKRGDELPFANVELDSVAFPSFRWFTHLDTNETEIRVSE